MIKHTEVFDRCFEDGDYPAVMLIEEICRDDVEGSEKEYFAAYENYKTAKAAYDADQSILNLHKKNWAEVEKLRAKFAYQEKYAIYCDFMNN